LSAFDPTVNNLGTATGLDGDERVSSSDFFEIHFQHIEHNQLVDSEEPTHLIEQSHFDFVQYESIGSSVKN
jgi:hypothetical protein